MTLENYEEWVEFRNREMSKDDPLFAKTVERWKQALEDLARSKPGE